MSLIEELDYYHVLKNMGHEIDANTIKLFIDRTKTGNSLSQFRNLIEEIKKSAVDADRERMGRELKQKFRNHKKLYNSGSNLDITENQAEDYIEEVLGDGK